MKDIHKQEDVLGHDLVKLKTSQKEIESTTDERLQNLLPFVKKRIQDIYDEQQVLREARCKLKGSVEFANVFTSEGSTFHYLFYVHMSLCTFSILYLLGLYKCVVQNVRGGNMVRKVVSTTAVIFVEQAMRFITQMKPHYARRGPKFRRKWSIYSSVWGTFNNGRLEGIVTLRYYDGSIYEGPYISEEWLDEMGHVSPGGRAENHYGVWKCGDGDTRIFEGHNVDNHFDTLNLQSHYRVTYGNGEIYEVC